MTSKRMKKKGMMKNSSHSYKAFYFNHANQIKVSNKMNRIVINLVAMIFISGILACGGSKKALIAPSDISQAKDNGTLESLYDRAGQLILDSRGSNKKEFIQIQSQIAALLVQDRVSQVSDTLANKKTQYGLVDRVTLVSLKDNIANMNQWDAKRYVLLMPKVQQAIDQTNFEISDAVSKTDDNSVDIVEKMRWMKKSAILSGKGQIESEQYQKKLAESILRLSTTGRDAYKKRMYNIALESAQKGIVLDPGNIQFESLLSQSEAALFEQNFRSAMENAKPELAYQAFIEVADKPIMLQIRKKMERTISFLANYFASNAQKSYNNNDLYTAYTEFQRGRDIQQKLALNSRGFIQEKKFLDLVMQKASALQNANGQKFALLSVIKEFDPAYPTLEESMAKLVEDISNRATTKLAMSEFKEVLSSNSVVASVGRRVASKLEKILFEKLANELQIVTDISSVQDSKFSGVALSIDGEVLQAAIETTKNQGQRSVNVLTGINQLETAEYSKWKKRKRGEPPTQYVEEKIMEDVTIRVEHIRKLAVVEVAYRIVEPSTQKVLLTDNITKEVNHQGESTNEFQKGLFHQAYVATDLPSDIKIMDNLSAELSKELGTVLSNYLASPEKVFQQKYEQALEQGNHPMAVEMLSNAVVISDKKGRSNPDWLATLKQQVLKAK